MWTAQFIQYLRYEKNYSSHTVSAYENDLSQFAAYLAGEYALEAPEQADTDMVRSWMVSLMESGCTPRSVCRKLSALKSFWRFLLRRGAVDRDPLRGLTPPKIHKPLPSFLKESEVDALLGEDFTDVADGNPANPVSDNSANSASGASDGQAAAAEANAFRRVRDHLVLEMLVQTGMRRAELIGLSLSDVDEAACQVRVLGKRDKQRIIPFGESLRDEIARYLELRRPLGGSPAFFVRENGQPLYPTLVYRLAHERLSAVATLSKSSPHVLRHTFATEMLNAGAELNAVKELLGHASLSATEVYTHTTFEEMKQVYQLAHPRAEK